MNNFMFKFQEKCVFLNEFNFPDGQPHLNLPQKLYWGAEVSLKCRLKSSDDLIKLLLLNDVLNRFNCKKKELKIMYLLGARMDRPIDFFSPFTLEVVSNIIKSCEFESVSLFVPHSKAGINMLNAKAEYPTIYPILNKYMPLGEESNKKDKLIYVAPDAGAYHWINEIVGNCTDVVGCDKTRDSQTGKLTNFSIISNEEKIKDRICLIVDDICDGGRTFIGIAKKLKEAGARKVILFVAHGIFSNGYELEGIDEIWTTNSYKDASEYPASINIIPSY